MPQHDASQTLDLEIAALRVQLAFLYAGVEGIKAGFRHDQSRDARGRWDGGRGTVIVTRVEATGNARIDARTKTLVDVVKEIVEDLGGGSGAGFGIQVHLQSARAIRSLDLPGTGRHGVEQSFSGGGLVRYGLDGSVRTDVILRDGRTESAPILAVWDIKTGRARLSAKRVADIRAALNVGKDVPVIEIHVERGVSVKSVVFRWM